MSTIISPPANENDVIAFFSVQDLLEYLHLPSQDDLLRVRSLESDALSAMMPGVRVIYLMSNCDCSPQRPCSQKKFSQGTAEQSENSAYLDELHGNAAKATEEVSEEEDNEFCARKHRLQQLHILVRETLFRTTQVTCYAANSSSNEYRVASPPNSKENGDDAADDLSDVCKEDEPIFYLGLVRNVRVLLVDMSPYHYNAHWIPDSPAQDHLSAIDPNLLQVGQACAAHGYRTKERRDSPSMPTWKLNGASVEDATTSPHSFQHLISCVKCLGSNLVLLVHEGMVEDVHAAKPVTSGSGSLVRLLLQTTLFSGMNLLGCRSIAMNSSSMEQSPSILVDAEEEHRDTDGGFCLPDTYLVNEQVSNVTADPSKDFYHEDFEDAIMSFSGVHTPGHDMQEQIACIVTDCQQRQAGLKTTLMLSPFVTKRL